MRSNKDASENTSDVWKVVGAILLGLASILGLAWAVQGNDFALYRVFAPKYEAVRRQTFEQSRAFREGQAQELRRMQSEYVRSKPEQQDALRSIILHQFADTDENALPTDLRNFLHDIRQ